MKNIIIILLIILLFMFSALVHITNKERIVDSPIITIKCKHNHSMSRYLSKPNMLGFMACPEGCVFSVKYK